jgi:hypothetical protein
MSADIDYGMSNDADHRNSPRAQLEGLQLIRTAAFATRSSRSFSYCKSSVFFSRTFSQWPGYEAGAYENDSAGWSVSQPTTSVGAGRQRAR